ncbi:MAG: hypothetical protein ACYTG2_06875 [Planctomycetota bacterium]|jgi:hypothetical protein
MKQTALCLMFLLAALFTGADAQEVFTGSIEPASLASFCQEETHYLTCTAGTPGAPTGVLLKSTVLDLDDYVGKLTRFTAFPRGVECLIYDVVAAQPATSTLVSCGSPVPGCPMRFRVGPTGVLGQWVLFFSLSPDFLPVNPVKGTWLLGSPSFLVAQGSTSGSPTTLDIVLPPSVALTGLELWLQGARRDIGPIGPWEFSNAVCFTILGPSPPCLSIDC